MSGVDLEQMAATVAEGMKVVLMIGDIRLKEEHVGVAGDVYILDASVATPQNFANHFAKFTPSLIKKFLICVQVYILHYVTHVMIDYILCQASTLTMSNDFVLSETICLIKY